MLAFTAASDGTMRRGRTQHDRPKCLPEIQKLLTTGLERDGRGGVTGVRERSAGGPPLMNRPHADVRV